MITGGELGLAVKAASFFKGIWQRTPFAKIAALNTRVAALEIALAKCPAEGCPFCGARAWRLQEVMFNGEGERWHCLDCGKQRDYRLDLAGRDAPGGSFHTRRKRS